MESRKWEWKTTVGKILPRGQVQRRMADPCTRMAQPWLCSLHGRVTAAAPGVWPAPPVSVNQRWLLPLCALPIWGESCHKEMVTVVARWSPPKPPVGMLRTHAHLHLCSKLLVLKGREQSLKDPEETEKWADCSPYCSRACSRNHLPPWRIPGSLQSEGPSQGAEWWAFSASASLRSPWMDGSMSWWQTHSSPTPVLCIHIKGKQEGSPFLAPSLQRFSGQQGEGWSTHRARKKPTGNEL